MKLRKWQEIEFDGKTALIPSAPHKKIDDIDKNVTNKDSISGTLGSKIWDEDPQKNNVS